MAKSKKLKKSVPKKPNKQDLKQKALNKEYATQRKLLLQNIRRLEARGYDVSGIVIPEIPKKKERKDINELKRINANRYKNATFEVEVIKNKGRKNERIEVTKVKGTKYVKQENKIRAEKAAATRRENKKLKEEEKTKIIDYGIVYEGGEITSPPIGETKPKGGYGSEIDYIDFGTWFNPETGEIREGRKPRYGTWYNELEAKEWYDQNIYQNVIKKVENMQIYEGKTKRSMQIKSNADLIRQKIEEEYKKDPKNVTRVLSEMESIGALDDVEIWYFAHGYNKFEYDFMMYLGLFNENGVYNDEEEYTDYDE